MPSRPVVLSFVAGAGIVALVATSVTAVVQSGRAAEEEARADELAAEVERLETRVAELEEEVASGGGVGDLIDELLGGNEGQLDGLLDGLLEGGDGEGDLGGLLDGLLSDSGDIGGLLGGAGGIPGLECITPDGGGLEGLLDGGLDGLLGGGDGGGDGGEAVADDPDDLVATISDQVADLRERSFDGEVEVAFLGDDALAAELEQILDRDLDLERLAAQEDVLQALRAVPASADLEQLNRDLLEGQVAGFYAPEDRRLVVRTPEQEVRPLDRVTLAHELDHALVDQVVGLPDLDDGTDADAALARLSVIEGDATLLMNRWTLEHLSLADQVGMAGGGDFATSQEQLADVPHHLARELLFPYTAGLENICDLWLEGGWDAVDAAYADPPTTSAGVMFPGRADDVAAEVPPLSAPSGGQLRFEDTFGAAPLTWLFEAPGGDLDAALDDPLDRAAAWSAGAVRLWDLDGDRVVGLALRDRDAGDPSLCASVTDWYTAAAPDARASGSAGDTTFTGGETTVVVTCDDDEVRVGIAPDATVAAEVTSG